MEGRKAENRGREAWRTEDGGTSESKKGGMRVVGGIMSRRGGGRAVERSRIRGR